jgi:hypothetical protein
MLEFRQGSANIRTERKDQLSSVFDPLQSPRDVVV